MEFHPLESLSLSEAKKVQFRIVDLTTKYFTGKEVLSLGDLGVVPGINKPTYTVKVEDVLKDLFHAEAAVLLRGAGTGALREGIQSILKPGEVLLVHDAPIYPTTQNTLENMGIRFVFTDFNDQEALRKVLQENAVDAALIQYTRQKPDDSYDMGEVIEAIRLVKGNLPIITDDNYAVFKARKVGVELGADLSAFSAFKLLGPEGVGILVGRKEKIDLVKSRNYSGGGQVQGYEAMEVLRGLVYAPVMIAIQNEVLMETKERLDSGEVEGIKATYVANAQSKVLLVEFEENIAKEVLVEAEKLGAAQNPVGAESKYEFVPMFYRVSGTFRAFDPTIEERMIRINPMRSGLDTIIRILRESMEKIERR